MPYSWPHPPSIPTHSRWSVGPTAFSHVRASPYQAEPFTYYTVVPVPSLVKSNSPRLLWWPWLWIPLPTLLPSGLLQAYLIWILLPVSPHVEFHGQDSDLPSFFIFFIFLLRQCLSFLPFPPCAKPSLPLAQAMSGCALGAMHWSFWNFLYVMFHQTGGAVNESCGATFLLWSPSNELQL